MAGPVGLLVLLPFTVGATFLATALLPSAWVESPGELAFLSAAERVGTVGAVVPWTLAGLPWLLLLRGGARRRERLEREGGRVGA